MGTHVHKTETMFDNLKEEDILKLIVTMFEWICDHSEQMELSGDRVSDGILDFMRSVSEKGYNRLVSILRDKSYQEEEANG